MTIEELKSVSLTEYLSRHGYKCARQQGRRYWYSSPIRHGDATPSFKVDVETNLWYDFGLGKGGNIINLVKELYPHCSNHEVLTMLEAEVRVNGYSYAKDYGTNIGYVSPAYRPKQLPPSHRTHVDETKVVCVIGLSHTHLLEYVSERHVSIEVAKRYCSEVHYQAGYGRFYYAIAFLNVSGGMEVRNKYSKRCIGGKDISVIRNEPNSTIHCCVFEGFFDFLSYMTLKEMGDSKVCLSDDADYIVLNSVNNIGKAFPIIAQYNHIHCYLDNDNAGHTATEIIASLHPEKVIDESRRYMPHNDLNNFLKSDEKLQHL